MSEVIFLAAPGFFARTGYYYRVLRDQELLQSCGVMSHIRVITRRGIVDESGRKVAILEFIKEFRLADHVVYENVSTTIFSWFGLRNKKNDYFVLHGSLAELDVGELAVIKKIVYRRLLNSAGSFKRVVVVSSALKDELCTIYKVPPSKIAVFPNVPSSNFVNRLEYLWNKEDKFGVRSRLGLAACAKYLCYTGNTQPWQKAQLLIEVFSILTRINQNVNLLILTRDEEVFKSYLTQSGVPDSRYVIRCVDNSEVPDYLYASDLLYLVRDNSPINRVACPTKAMEYLASGRPIIVSLGLGDIPAWVGEDGVVINQDDFDAPADIAARVHEKLESVNDEYEIPDFGFYKLNKYKGCFDCD